MTEKPEYDQFKTLTEADVRATMLPERLWKTPNVRRRLEIQSESVQKTIRAWIDAWSLEGWKERPAKGLFLTGDEPTVERLASDLVKAVLRRRRKALCIAADDVRSACIENVYPSEENSTYWRMTSEFDLLMLYNFPIRERRNDGPTFLDRVMARRFDNMLPIIYCSHMDGKMLGDILLETKATPIVIRSVVEATDCLHIVSDEEAKDGN